MTPGADSLRPYRFCAGAFVKEGRSLFTRKSSRRHYVVVIRVGRLEEDTRAIYDHVPIQLPTHPPVYLPTYLTTYLPACLFACLLIYLHTYLPI